MAMGLDCGLADLSQSVILTLPQAGGGRMAVPIPMQIGRLHLSQTI